MAKIRLILDRRRADVDGLYPVRIYVYHRGQIYLSTDIKATLNEWSDAQGVLGRDAASKSKNARLRDMLNRCDMLLLNLSVSGELPKMTDKALRSQLEKELGITRGTAPLLHDYLEKAKRGKAERTQRLFTWAQQRVKDVDANARVADIDEGWMTKFRDELSNSYSPNTVAQAMAWVSRALSLAVADGVILRNSASGVRKPKQETRKKSLSLERVRELRDMQFTGRNAASLEYARDIWMLQFYLLGINVVDLCELKEIVNGRVEYTRHKTKTLYSVKVMPEAEAIINKWRGRNTLIDIKHYKTSGALCTCLSRWLDQMIPGLSTNYARHTWATLAAELDIPIETISHALGHKIGSPVTAIYVAYNQNKVDAANRRVIDYLNADLKK